MLSQRGPAATLDEVLPSGVDLASLGDRDGLSVGAAELFEFCRLAAVKSGELGAQHWIAHQM
jgi:hypothetical protein